MLILPKADKDITPNATDKKNPVSVTLHNVILDALTVRFEGYLVSKIIIWGQSATKNMGFSRQAGLTPVLTVRSLLQKARTVVFRMKV